MRRPTTIHSTTIKKLPASLEPALSEKRRILCTHDGGPLGDGTLQGCEIACPRRDAKFDIRDGRILTMPASEATVAHELMIDGNDVLVRINDD